MLKKKQFVILNCTCLFAYILGAYIGKLLILSPSGASSIWPPAGIALAMLLLYGRVILLGIFLGSLLTHIPHFFNKPSVDSVISSLPTGIFISLGVCLQAMLATYLIRRFVGKNDPLIEDLKIFKFLFLGSIIGSSIAPIFFSIELFYRQVINYSELFSAWATWWVGDAIGILIITPLILIFFAKPRELWKKRRNYVFYPSLMLLIFSIIILNYGKQQEAIQIKEIFDRQSTLFDDILFNKIRSYLRVNLVLKSFFENTSFVNTDEFHRFSKAILQEHQTLASIEWVPYIKSSQRAEFEALSKNTIQEFSRNNSTVIAAKRKYYFPITYFESLKNSSQILGVDLRSDPIIFRSLLQAWESEIPVVSNKLMMTKNKTFIGEIKIYSAVFSPSFDENVNLKGFVGNTFFIEKEMEALTQQNKKLQIEIEILEGNTVIYSSFSQKKPQKINGLSLFRNSTLNFANKRWQLSYMPSKKFKSIQKYWGQWWLLLGSFLFTGLTGVALLMLTGRTLRTEELVDLRTLALSKAIAERDLHNKVLQAMVSPMPLDKILALVVQMVEANNPNMLCSILLLDETNKHLIHKASGRLPSFYTQAINGIEIGEGVGSCGTAVYLKHRVIVSDISLHPYWVNFTGLAKKAGLAACWSEPIMNAEQQVLGTFAIYYQEPKSPDKEILDKIISLSQLISLAIEKKTSEERVRYLAFYDALTKLPNRRLLYERLNQELILVERHHNYGALMFLDLDHFKTLNDSLGHHIGDELLIQVAKRLEDCVREEDTVARLGGDEFVVLLRNRDSENSSEQALDYALMIAKRILKSLYIPYKLEKYEHVVTSSIGITLFGVDNKNIDSLFKQADTAMYEAKNKGRNTFSFYNNNMAEQANQRLQMENDLRNALTHSQFILHYQGQYNEQGRIMGAEALLRWSHPQKGMIAVLDFMPSCEESGLILAIAEWELKIICQQLINWSTLPYISLNVSSRQFYQQQFVEQIELALAENKLSPERLMLEITEIIVAKDIKESVKKLNALRALGVQIAIDDFGMGYSSLADLKSLPIDQLKIDQSFIRDLCVDDDVALIVEAMLMMATHLGLHIIAEGVETSEQIQFLKRNQCYHYQGYYFSQPLASSEFSLLLAKNESF
jgi:diguanylate cyclase (GGDEF)-like protein